MVEVLKASTSVDAFFICLVRYNKKQTIREDSLFLQIGNKPQKFT